MCWTVIYAQAVAKLQDPEQLSVAARREYANVAAARSSSAVPTDLNSVISSAERRPGRFAAAEVEEVADDVGSRR